MLNKRKIVSAGIFTIMSLLSLGMISCHKKQEATNKETTAPVDRPIDKPAIDTGRAEREREIRRQIEEEKLQKSEIIQFGDMKEAIDVFITEDELERRRQLDERQSRRKVSDTM